MSLEAISMEHTSDKVSRPARQSSTIKPAIKPRTH